MNEDRIKGAMENINNTDISKGLEKVSIQTDNGINNDDVVNKEKEDGATLTKQISRISFCSSNLNRSQDSVDLQVSVSVTVQHLIKTTE